MRVFGRSPSAFWRTQLHTIAAIPWKNASQRCRVGAPAGVSQSALPTRKFAQGFETEPVVAMRDRYTTLRRQQHCLQVRCVSADCKSQDVWHCLLVDSVKRRAAHHFATGCTATRIPSSPGSDRPIPTRGNIFRLDPPCSSALLHHTCCMAIATALQHPLSPLAVLLIPPS